MKTMLFTLFLLSMQILSHAQPGIKWKFDTKDIAFGQSAAADIDGDGKLEIVFGCYRNDSCIYALNGEDGSLLWKYNTHTGFAEGCNDVAPVMYDVDGDGQLEVIVPSSCNPKTYCLDGATGAVKWICNTRGSDSPPTIADVDGDGKPEILHGQFGGYVICINAENGTVAWEIAVDTSSWIQTAPTIVDADNDGQLDFIVATWNAVNKANNKVYAYRAHNQSILWTYPLNDVVYHGTAVGDLDNDGKKELIIGSYNDTLYCLNAENGTAQWKYSAGDFFAASSPAVIADVNEDGQCEIIFTAWYKVTALQANGSVLWQYNMPNFPEVFRGVAIADINNNIYKDVVFGASNGVLTGLNGQDGSLIFSKNLRTDYGDSLFSIVHAPLIADFDQDGKIDVFIHGGHGEYPNFSNDFGRGYLLTIGVGRGPDWLMFQNDIMRRSNICESPNNIAALTTESPQITISPNPASGQINVELTLTQTAQVHIDVYNTQGQYVQQLFEGKVLTGNKKITGNEGKDYASGIYLLHIKIDDYLIVKKLSIQ